MRGDVLGCEQPLFDLHRHATLEQHRLLGSPDRLQQQVVLAIARADLEYVRILGDQVDVLGAEHFGNDRQSCLLARFGQQFEPLLTQSAKLVG
ncbi:hypothetical protein HRbin27_00526 [bacterium HR27]|nr:hypothetical protein HRbin27_00526 [bacterium HR27]